MTVEVRIDPGLLRRLLRRRGGAVERSLAKRTQRVAEIAQREAPGHMGDFVTWKITEGPKGLQGVVVCNHPAVLLVLKGTVPHLIRPRRKQFLRFEVDGRVVYTKLVRHPGTKPNDFMARALHEGR